MDSGQPKNAVFLIALLPARDRGRERSEPFFDLAVGSTFIQQQDDPHALRHARRKVPFAQIALQFASLARGQVQDFYLRHKHRAKIYCYSLLRDSPLELPPTEIEQQRSCWEWAAWQSRSAMIFGQ